MTRPHRNTQRHQGVRRLMSAAAVTVTLLTMSVLAAGPASAQIRNPTEGIVPTLDFLGPAFNNVWVRVFGSIWGVLLGAAAIKFFAALYKIRAAKAGGYGTEMADASSEARVAGVAFGCLAAGGVIIGAILFVVGG
ncbi:MAG: hypothetical protein WAW17_07010 [Rhodococcus sp. (in: high G+C Gram-positive bacteria)]|uniref:hypothetical protein n=1 Tax=Rhodococcus sp. TaxID=1831 RepID=UPI003BB1BA2D